MNVDDINDLVFARSGQNLSDVQRLVLGGSLQGQTYEQIAATSNYSEGYFKKVVGPELWKLLSAVAGEEVTKTNHKSALERALRNYQANQSGIRPATGSPTLSPTISPTPESSGQFPASVRSNAWDGVPEVRNFWGRTQQIQQLQKWLATNQAAIAPSPTNRTPSTQTSPNLPGQKCRLLVVSGMGGVGKTNLVAKLTEQVRPQFGYVVWRSLEQAPLFPELLAELLRHLTQKFGVEPVGEGRSQPEPLTQLMHYLHRHRCLIVLDEFETVLSGGELAGQYRPEYQAYRDWLRRIAEEPHQSCVILTGRESPGDLEELSGENSSVRHFKLRGLDIGDAIQLLESRGISCQQSGVETLILRYRGNPSALKMIASTVRELFDGNIRPVLSDSTIMVHDALSELLNDQFKRLSTQEQEILYWLAVESCPMTFQELRQRLRFTIPSSSELVAALQSLKRRSLLENGAQSNRSSSKDSESQFHLEPVVMKHAVKRLIDQVCNDILVLLETQSHKNLGLLRSHSLVGHSPIEQNSVTQMRLVLRPLIERLQNYLKQGHFKHDSLEAALNISVNILADKSDYVTGYAQDNIRHLLTILEG